jgi:Bifunctional DNA primase/polymerase, N-terminal
VTVSVSASEVLASAAEFIELGCRCGPCSGKNPGMLGATWQQKWTRDINVVADWFERWPRANLGVLPDQALCPLDIDDPASFERLQTETAPAPPTPQYLTGGGPGRKRLLFRYDHRLEHAGRKLADGVQLRFCTPDSALMCVVPPSIHPVTKVRVEWIAALDEMPIAPLPEAWLQRVVPNGERKQAKPTEYWRELAESSPKEGDRHTVILAFAGHLLARGVDPRVATQLLCGWARWKCTNGSRVVTDEEVARAVLYVARKEARG